MKSDRSSLGIPDAAYSRELLLLGGGHSHAIVLRRWAEARARGRSPQGVRLILVSDGHESPYSGMLPGLVAGQYSHDDCHIDLRRLARTAGAVFYCDRAIGLDPVAQRLSLAEHPPLRYDWLSLNIGSRPGLGLVPGASAYAIGAKPVPLFLATWRALLTEVEAQPPRSLSIAIVGAGAGGVELALAMEAGLRPWMAGPGRLRIHLIQRGPQLLPQHGVGARLRLARELADRGIQIHLSQSVEQLEAEMTLLGPSGRVEIRAMSGDGAGNLRLACDRVFWVTEACAPDWLAASGLAVDGRGFVQVDDRLQSMSHPTVLAAGDIASQVGVDRPKAGVYAVRQGRPLFETLQALIAGRSPRPYQPQSQILGLIGTGDGRAIASWGSGWRSWSWGPNAAIWAWKDRIDRRFMDQFTDPHPDVAGPDPGLFQRLDVDGLNPADAIVESGGGIQVSAEFADRLSQTLSRLSQQDSPWTFEFKSTPIQSIELDSSDAIATAITDPVLFAEVLTNHGLNSYLAIGTMPPILNIILGVPSQTQSLLEETVIQLCMGINRAIQSSGLGDKSPARIELSVVQTKRLTLHLRLQSAVVPVNNHLQPSLALILTKALGSQALATAPPRDIEPILASLTQSNGPGRASLADVPAIAIGSQGLQAALDQWNLLANQHNAHLVVRLGVLVRLPGEVERRNWPNQCRTSLNNPELSGPLLLAVPAEQLASALKTLRGLGYIGCRPIGWVRSGRNKVEFESD